MSIDDLHLFFIINEKGGAAKTTSAINLFGQLKSMGFMPLIFDCDVNGKAAHVISQLGEGWLRGCVLRAKEDTVDYFEEVLAMTADMEFYNCVIFDTPPQLSEMVKNLLQVAKNHKKNARIMVPVMPSAQDIGLSHKTVNYIQETNPGQTVYILPSNVDRRTTMSGAIFSAFQAFKDVQILTPVYRNTEITKQGGWGETLHELKRTPESSRKVMQSLEKNVIEMGVTDEQTTRR